MNESPYYADDRATLYGGAHFQAGRMDAGRFNDDGTPIRWEQIGPLDQHAYRELVSPIVHAAAPHIAEQVRP